MELIKTPQKPSGQCPKNRTKAKILQLELIHLFAREVLLVQLEIEETKTT